MALELYRYTERNAEHKVGDMWEAEDGQIIIARGVPDGSTITTPKQRAAAGLHFAGRAERWGNKSDLGKFVFAHLSANYNSLSDQSLARLVYLSTFLKRDTSQLFYNRRPMSYKDLQGILGLSERTISRFFKEASEFITASPDNSLFLSGNALTKGKLQRNVYEDLQMCYCDTIRRLYKQTPKSKHHLLGMIFRLLLYVNREYNILCQNPFEDDLDSIIPLSVKEFCALSGYNYSKVSVLRSELKKLTFEVDGKQSLFCSFVDSGLGADHIWIVVNPRILYSGTDYKKVEVLGKFCEL